MLHKYLKRKKIVLASASPRRKHIFDMVGIKSLQKPADVDETIHTTNPRKLVLDHASAKARAIGDMLDQDCLVVGSDTIVYHDGKILGKPEDVQSAQEYLQKLSGDSHSVYTGVCIIYRNREYKDYARTKVKFQVLSDKEISDYIMTHEPFDKAGAYGIQGFGGQFIESISGCYFNVMGFPISLFYKMIKDIFDKNE